MLLIPYSRKSYTIHLTLSNLWFMTIGSDSILKFLHRFQYRHVNMCGEIPWSTLRKRSVHEWKKTSRSYHNKRHLHIPIHSLYLFIHCLWIWWICLLVVNWYVNLFSYESNLKFHLRFIFPALLFTRAFLFFDRNTLSNLLSFLLSSLISYFYFFSAWSFQK